MTSQSAYVQINSLLAFLQTKPNCQQLVRFLSEKSAPNQEVCGVGVFRLNGEGLVAEDCRHGFHESLPVLPPFEIDSLRPSAVALKSRAIQYFSFQNFGNNYDLPSDYYSFYHSGVALPVTRQVCYGFGFEMNIEELQTYSDYFECLNSSLGLYETLMASQKKRKDSNFSLSNQMTPRQDLILRLIREGKSNRVIAEELSYSISLIRQETMRIYKILEVDGRRTLRKPKP